MKAALHRSAVRLFTVALVGIVVVLPGCERAAVQLHAVTGAYTGSTEPLEIPADAVPSAYASQNPLAQLVDGILGRRLEIKNEGGLAVEQWVWVIGPGIRTAGISFEHAVLVEIVAGTGIARLTRGGEQSFSAGDSFFISPTQPVTFENASDIPIDIRATYLIDPALNRG